MRTEHQYAAIGAIGGGIAGIVLGMHKRWSKGKVALAGLAGAGVGAGAGYGAGRLVTSRPSPYTQTFGLDRQGSGAIFPAPKEENVYIAGAEGEDVEYKKCAMPSRPTGGDFEQWSVLVRNKDPKDLPSVTSSWDVYKKILRPMGRLPQEEMIVVYLNNQNKVIGTSTVSRGTKDSAVVDPADILRPGILSGASRFIIAHNHPSGEVVPSKSDVALSERVEEAANTMKITLLDSLVVGDNTYASLRDLGLLR